MECSAVSETGVQLCRSKHSVDEQNQIDSKTIDKYQSILRVFLKARINTVATNKNEQITSESIPFADERCILFDYRYMYSFSEKHYRSDMQNFRKAFYLSRLQKHDVAFSQFSKIAQRAFERKDYLLYYLAESNCISLSKVIKSRAWDSRYNKHEVDELSPNESEIEDLFRRLPASFRNDYSNLNNLHNVNLLYRYAYDSFVAGQKLQKVLDSESIEFGMTSSGSAICRINSYLHFLLGNGIISDIFTEYINTVKYLMSMLIHKYSSQQKQTLYSQPFLFQNTPEVFFDEIDFYCFISCFSDKEIDTLFHKHGIKTIEFQHMDLIEVAVSNLLSSYELARKDSKFYFDILHLERQIKTCMALLRFINISQNAVDLICSFILKYEFREIYIDDKIMFFDSQLYQRKMYSESTSCEIERTLIHYIDLEISNMMQNKSFSLISTRSGINYYNLVYYIHPKEENYISSKLSIRVKKIFSHSLSKMYRHVFLDYFEYISSIQQKRAIAVIKKELKREFSFVFFSFLVWSEAEIDARILEQLVFFLRTKVEESKRIEKKNKEIRYPEYNPFEELEQVGYWCFFDRLSKSDYKEFLGCSNLFDFLLEYPDFCFFDVSWLFNFSDSILGRIVEDTSAKDKIRSTIAVELEKKKLLHSEYERLNEILIKYFC